MRVKGKFLGREVERGTRWDCKLRKCKADQVN